MRLLIAALALTTGALAQIPDRFAQIPNRFTASEAYDCSRPVVDRAHVLKDELPVFGAAQKLQNSGADIYVRILQGLNYPTLEKEVAAHAKACPNWQDRTGRQLKNNAIVIFIAVNERRIGLWFGSRWEPVLAGPWTKIEAGMEPYLKVGDYSAAVVKALGDIQVQVSGSTPSIFWWLLGFSSLLVVGSIWLIIRRKKDEAEVDFTLEPENQPYSASRFASRSHIGNKLNDKSYNKLVAEQEVVMGPTRDQSIPSYRHTPNKSWDRIPNPAETIVVEHHYQDDYNPLGDPLNPLNPLNPISHLSPLSPFNSINEQERRIERLEEQQSYNPPPPPEPEQRRSSSYDDPDTGGSSSWGSSDSSYDSGSSSFDSGSSSFDTGSGGDSGF